MSLTIWLTILVPLVLFGWLIGQVMPTPRDRQLKRLRDRARVLDLHVGMRRIRDPDPAPEERVDGGGRARDARLEVAAYAHPLRLPGGVSTRDVPAWRVLWMHRHADVVHDAGLPPGWKFDKAELPLRDETLAQLTPLLQRVPRGTASVEADGRDVSLCWRERGEIDEIDAIAALLTELAAFQTELGLAAVRRREQGSDPD